MRDIAILGAIKQQYGMNRAVLIMEGVETSNYAIHQMQLCIAVN